jgi:hypothetical protein
MNPQLEPSIDRIRSQARRSYQRFFNTVRTTSGQAAGRVKAGKKPLKTLNGLGLKLSGVSHRTADKLLTQQTRLLANQLDTLASRLDKAADADSIRAFLGTQFSMLPEQFGRLAADTRASLDIVVNAGSEARELLQGTVSELRGRNAPARKKATRKTTARKTAAKKARKTTAARATRGAAADANPAS